MAVAEDQLQGVPTHGIGRLHGNLAGGNGLGCGVAGCLLTQGAGATVAQKFTTVFRGNPVLPGDPNPRARPVNGFGLNLGVGHGACLTFRATACQSRDCPLWTQNAT